METQEKTPKTPYYNNPDKRKGIAVLLWFVGYFGYLNIHNFYLGKVKVGLLKLGIFAAGIAATVITATAGERRSGPSPVTMVLMIALMVWNVVEIVRISKMAMSPEATELAKARLAERVQKQQKSMGWKVFGLFVSIFFIIGGASGSMVLRGTDSSQALVVVGVIYLIISIISIANHNKQKNEGQ